MTIKIRKVKVLGEARWSWTCLRHMEGGTAPTFELAVTRAGNHFHTKSHEVYG